MTIQSIEPTSFVAGDTLSWKKSLSDYPASDGWSLAYRLINSVGNIDIASAASGDDHLVSVAAATTAAYTPGDYRWQAFVTKASERYTVGTGRLTIKPNLAAEISGYDTRTHARKVLEALEAVLEGRASKSHLEYEIAGRRIKEMTPDQLLVLRDRYRADVRAEEDAERVASGLPSRKRVLVRF